MKALDARVARLESRRGPHLPPVAVVSVPLPPITDAGWARDLLRRFGWEGHDLAMRSSRLQIELLSCRP